MSVTVRNSSSPEFQSQLDAASGLSLGDLRDLKRRCDGVQRVTLAIFFLLFVALGVCARWWDHSVPSPDIFATPLALVTMGAYLASLGLLILWRDYAQKKILPAFLGGTESLDDVIRHRAFRAAAHEGQ